MQTVTRKLLGYVNSFINYTNYDLCNTIITPASKMLLCTNFEKFKNAKLTTKIVTEFNLKKLTEISNFLNKYAVHNEKFQVAYTPEYVNWLLQPNGILIELYYEDDELIGIMGGRKTKFNIVEKNRDVFSFRFLCIDSQFRKKKYSKIIINSLIKTLASDGDLISIFLTNVLFMNRIRPLKYYYRPLCYKKIIEHKLITEKVDDQIKFYAVDNNILEENESLQQLTSENSTLYGDSIYLLYQEQNERYILHESFGNKDLLLTKLLNPFVYTYILLKDNELCDFFVFYIINQKSIMKKNLTLSNGYVYFYTSLQNTTFRIVKLLLTKMHEKDIDFVYMLDNLENKLIIDSCKFSDVGEATFLNLYNMKLSIKYDAGIGACEFV